MNNNVNKYNGLSSLAPKYGIAMLVLFLNGLFAMPLVWQVITGFAEFPKEMTHEKYFWLLTANEISSYTVPLIIFFLLFGREAKSKDVTAYKRFPLDSAVVFICGLGCGAAGSKLSNMIADLISSLSGAEKPAAAFSSTMPTDGFTLAVFMTCTAAAAPLCEEILFRYLLLRPLRKYGDMTAAVVSSLIFGLYHRNFDQFAYVVIMGFALSVIAIRAGSVIPSMLLHVINNICVGLINYMPKTAPDGLMVISDIVNAVMFALIIIGILLMFVPHVRKKIGINRDMQLLPLCREPMVIIGFAVMLLGFFIK